VLRAIAASYEGSGGNGAARSGSTYNARAKEDSLAEMLPNFRQDEPVIERQGALGTRVAGRRAPQ